MMKLKIAIILLVVSCNGRHGRTPTLDKAHQMHLEAVNLIPGKCQRCDLRDQRNPRKTNQIGLEFTKL